MDFRFGHSKFLVYFVLLYLTLDLASNAVGYRETSIGAYILPGSTFIYPITYTLADIITEVYSYTIMRKVIWAGIICDFVFSLSILAVMHLPHPVGWTHESAYDDVFGKLLRFNLACAIALFVGAFGNAYMIAKWGAIVRGKYFWLRSLGSSAVGQAIYLVVALTISFYGDIPFLDLVNMIILHYLFNVIYIMIAVIPASIGVYFLKKHESINIQEKKNFTPFKFT